MVFGHTPNLCTNICALLRVSVCTIALNTSTLNFRKRSSMKRSFRFKMSFLVIMVHGSSSSFSSSSRHFTEFKVYTIRRVRGCSSKIKFTSVHHSNFPVS